MRVATFSSLERTLLALFLACFFEGGFGKRAALTHEPVRRTKVTVTAGLPEKERVQTFWCVFS